MRARLLGAVLGAVLLLSMPVAAQDSPEGDPGGRSMCGPLTLLTVLLGGDFGEVPVESRATEAGHVLTAYVNPDTGSWTIVAHAAGMGCVVQGGYLDTLPSSLLPYYGEAA